MTLPHGLRAFRHRDYRLYFAGQGVSQIGTWLQLIATSWLIYRLSGSAFMLGLSAFALQIPYLLIGPFAGMWVDRVTKRRVLFVTQSVALTQSLVLLALVGGGHIEAWHMIAGNLVLGTVNAFDSPARQSLLIELVGGRDDLPSAIAFSSALMNGARFVGPMIGGAVIALAGEAWGFGLNSLSYCAVLAALAAIRAAPRQVETRSEPWLAQVAAGFRWTYGFLPTRSALLLVAVVSVSVQPYQSLMPWFAKEVFHGDSQTLGLLIGSAGLGALASMIYLASRRTIRGLLGMIGWSAAAAGAGLVGFAFCKLLWLACLLLFVTGVGIMLTAGSTNTILQFIVEDRLRARVVAIYMMSFLGVGPLGALAAGALAERIGPPVALALGGAIALAGAAVYARRLPAIRREIAPLYDRLGVAPRRD